MMILYIMVFVRYLTIYKMVAGLDTLVKITNRHFKLQPCHQFEHSRDVLLRLAEFLGEVFCRGFAGDLDERELLAVACGVTWSLTHAVLIISFHQVR